MHTQYHQLLEEKIPLWNELLLLAWAIDCIKRARCSHQGPMHTICKTSNQDNDHQHTQWDNVWKMHQSLWSAETINVCQWVNKNLNKNTSGNSLIQTVWTIFASLWRYRIEISSWNVTSFHHTKRVYLASGIYQGICLRWKRKLYLFRTHPCEC